MPSTPTHWNDIKRAQTAPPLGEDVPIWFLIFVRQQYFQLTNQINTMQTLFQTMHVTGMAPGAANFPVVLPHPYPNISYAIAGMADWNTTLFWSALTVTGFTINFGTVVPGANNTVCIYTVH